MTAPSTAMSVPIIRSMFSRLVVSSMSCGVSAATGSIEANAVYQLPVQRRVPRASRTPLDCAAMLPVVGLGDAPLLRLVGKRRELADVRHVLGVDAAGGGQRVAHRGDVGDRRRG